MFKENASVIEGRAYHMANNLDEYAAIIVLGINQLVHLTEEHISIGYRSPIELAGLNMDDAV